MTPSFCFGQVEVQTPGGDSLSPVLHMKFSLIGVLNKGVYEWGFPKSEKNPDNVIAVRYLRLGLRLTISNRKPGLKATVGVWGLKGEGL